MNRSFYKKHRGLVHACAIACFIVLAGIFALQENSRNSTETGQLLQNSVSAGEDSVRTEETAPQICVYVCGAVVHPGVYTGEEGIRVYQLVEMAGGLMPDADTASMNLAEVAKDGQKVYILAGTAAQTADEAADHGTGGKTAGLINLNQADREQLMELPGIGESRAEDILQYRREHGAFLTKEDLMKVPGIKEAAFEKIKDRISI